MHFSKNFSIFASDKFQKSINATAMKPIEEFLDYLRLELNYSKLTIDAYRADLNSWADFATGNRRDELSPETVTASDLRLWIGHLAGNLKNSPRTIRRKASALRAFFRFMMQRHGLASNPASTLILAKTSKDLPVYIRTGEMASVLADGEAADTPSADFVDTRDRLIVDLLYSSGMRCSELIKLRDVDTDTRKGELKVLGKRNKQRIIPIGPQLSQAIDSYRRLRDSSAATAISAYDREAPLLVGRTGQPLYRRIVYRIVNKALSEGGVHASRLSPHVLRHSFATDMLNSGAPINSVSQLLGHSSLASTQIYTHVTYSELKNNYKLAHPRALKKGGKNGN